VLGVKKEGGGRRKGQAEPRIGDDASLFVSFGFFLSWEVKIFFAGVSGRR